MNDSAWKSPEILVPRTFREMPRWRTDGTKWLDSLSERLANQCVEWSLRPDGSALHGSNAIAVPVTRHGVPFLLRMAPPHPSFQLEIYALRFWDGRGTVRLIEHDSDAGAMLLERLDTTETLSSAPLIDAVPVIARLMRRLAVPAETTDAASTADVVAARVGLLKAEWERLGKPFDRAILQQTLKTAQDLSSTPHDDAVNADLHFDQVLAGTREPWLAVDPVLLRGDIEYDLARILWTRLDEMTDDTEVLFHFDTVVREAQLDRERAWKWVLYRSVDYWLWGLDHGLTTDPERCRRLVAIFGEHEPSSEKHSVAR
ncbi:kinase [Cryobacterium sp. TMT2-15-1]|uniref:aminoglycoside phosphotransferase family protein n=1 Tax=Cryobacterium sp. TMT2-15-1 TaxID=1259246 RepID=UPI0010692A9C|nr:aminoglycoside phosphotransferase family protein [Cryobacterium sp. TMT2-15-1]TFC61198.1 kinase [Cryobacterium sp. TMT2-15-1]